MAKIIVTIDQQGNVQYEVEGVQGPSCEQLTSALERAVGDTEHVQLKEEYVSELPDYVDNLTGE